MPLKVLVTGATGLVGRHLVPKLLEGGYAVRVFLRPGRESALRQPDLTPFSKDRVEVVFGDLTKFDSLPAAVKGVQAIVHLGAQLPTAPEEEMKAVNIYGTRELVLAAKKANVRRFLHFSSAECTDNLVYNVFRDTKKASEKPVRGNNMEWTVFRPAPLYGPGDERFLGPLLRQIERGDPFDVPGDGKTKMGPVHADDAAKAVVNTLGYGMAVDAVYHFCSDGIGYDDMLKAIGRVVSKAPKIQHSSLAFNEKLLTIRDFLTRDPAKKLAISTRRNDLRYFLKDHIYPTMDTRDQVGFDPRPFETGVQQACASPWWKPATQGRASA
jgi:NADH dehydrogenase